MMKKRVTKIGEKVDILLAEIDRHHGIRTEWPNAAPKGPIAKNNEESDPKS